jgi:hypothetical protein
LQLERLRVGQRLSGMVLCNTATTNRVLTGLKSLSAFGEWDADACMWRRELPTPWGGTSIHVHEDPNRAGIGGECFLWPASLVLCDYIFRNPSAVRERHVLELGSSHGLAAMAARAAGSRRVLATDQAEVLPFLAGNVAANPAHAVEVAALEWGVSMEAWGAAHGWDWETVVGSDLTFNRSCFLPLLFTLQQLASRRNAGSEREGRGCKILLLHDDDSVPGGKSLRREFFEKAALPYFVVEPASLQETEEEDLGRSPQPAFESATVHAYWLVHRNGAPHIATEACAKDLAKWEEARRLEASTAALSSSTRRPGLGITLPELLAHFQRPVQEPVEKKGQTLRLEPTGAQRSSSETGAHASKGNVVQSTSAVHSQDSLNDVVSTEAKINWWDEDLEDPEPFEFTDEMLRGVPDGKGPWLDLEEASNWDALVAAEAAAAAKNPAGAWRHVSVDETHLPSLDGASDDENDDDDDAEAIVDIDALRTAARDRANVQLRGRATATDLRDSAQSGRQVLVTRDVCRGPTSAAPARPTQAAANPVPELPAADRDLDRAGSREASAAAGVSAVGNEASCRVASVQCNVHELDLDDLD